MSAPVENASEATQEVVPAVLVPAEARQPTYAELRVAGMHAAAQHAAAQHQRLGEFAEREEAQEQRENSDAN